METPENNPFLRYIRDDEMVAHGRIDGCPQLPGMPHPSKTCILYKNGKQVTLKSPDECKAEGLSMKGDSRAIRAAQQRLKAIAGELKYFNMPH